MKTILAHRGVTYNYPDNTIDSLCTIFNYSSTNFNFGVELDINLSSDNKLFIYHDSHIDNILLNTITYTQIKERNNNIPLFTSVLDKFNNTPYILDIEIKSYHNDLIHFTNIIFDIIKKYNINYFFSSFDINICNICTSNNFVCYKLSDIDEPPGDIVYYTQLGSNNPRGVYTLFNNEFSVDYLQHISNIDLLITDDIDRLIAFLSL